MAKDRKPVKHDESESDPDEEETEDPNEEEKDKGSSGEEDGSKELEDPNEEEKDKGSSGEEDGSEEFDSETEATNSQQQASTEDGDEFGSQSVSESDGPGVQESNIGAKKPISKPDDPAKSNVRKLSLRKAMKKTDPETAIKPNEDSKKLRFQRVWSIDDEIAILNGMIAHRRKKKSEPGADFHAFIKKNLRDDVTKVQLQGKIRKLKRKYMNNKSKGKGNRAFSKPHEQMVYELSKEVWDSVECVCGGAITNGNKSLGKRVMSSWGLTAEEEIIAFGADHFEARKGVEGDRQWKKLRVEEIELHLKLLELRKSQAELVLDALKSEH